MERIPDADYFVVVLRPVVNVVVAVVADVVAYPVVNVAVVDVVAVVVRSVVAVVAIVVVVLQPVCNCCYLGSRGLLFFVEHLKEHCMFLYLNSGLQHSSEWYYSG